MSSVNTGVYPCYENQFSIGNSGGSTSPTTNIADCEEFSVSFDNGVEEWKPYGEDGWTKRLMTAKSVTISVKGKRNIGDTGNDMVAGLAMKNGKDVEKDFAWNFPDGTKVWLKNAVISVTACGTGASTDVAPLEFEVMSNGKPVVTPAA